MSPRDLCLYYHDGPCRNPKACHEGHKRIDDKGRATCTSNGVVFLRSRETLYKESRSEVER